MNGDISDVKEHFLWRLAWISNVDKHRLVHPAVTLLQSGARWDEQQPKEMFFPRNNDVATIDEIELFDPQLTTKHQPIARVRITPAGPDPLVSISDAAAILTITELELDIVDLHHILARIGFIFYRFAPLLGWKPGAPLPIPY